MATVIVRAQLGYAGHSAGRSTRRSGLHPSARGLPPFRRIVCRSSEAEPTIGGGAPPSSTNKGGGGGGGGDESGGNGAAAGGTILAGRAIESLPAGRCKGISAGA